MTKHYDRFQPTICINEDDHREFDAIFIGGGAAGRFGSAYLRAMGGRQLIIEKGDHLGGQCCKNACVPHHLFFDLTVQLDQLRRFGGTYVWPKLDFKPKLADIIQMYLNGRENLYDFMFEQSKEQLGIEFILNHEPRIIDNHTVEVAGRAFKTKNIVLALGSRPNRPDIPGLHLKGVIDHTSLVEGVLDYEPERMVVIGGGHTMAPYASFFCALGMETTVVNRSPVLKKMDLETKAYVLDMMRERGVKFYENCPPLAILGEDRVTGVKIRTPEGEKVIPCDTVFLATGMRPNSDYPRQALGIEVDAKGTVIVDEYLRTNVPNVYAVGDLIGAPMEMFKARRSGMVASRNILGVPTRWQVGMFAEQFHSFYEVTYLGLTEEKAREMYGDDLMFIRMPPGDRSIALPAAERSITYSFLAPELSGFQKAIIQKSTRKVLGLHHVGFGAKEGFQYLSWIMQNGELTIDDFAEMNELFLNPSHFIQLARLRAGQRELVNL